MDLDDKVTREETAPKKGTLEDGAYEVIRKRLDQYGTELKDRIGKLNAARKSVFGAMDTKLLGSERIITENNCVPRDMVPVESCLIFGYNVQMGLKSKIALEDVFSIYEYSDRSFKKASLALIESKAFQDEFDELYKYYKNTFFAKFTVIEPHLYMIFQTGKHFNDFKAFKWLMEDGKLTYMDSRSEHEVRFRTHDSFNWTRTTRDDHRDGRFPHVSIMDKVFVETIHGDLTIKVEDNTATGKGIYSEPVEDKDQTLDDAEISYVHTGQLVIFKIRPYKENDFRYFIYNEKLKHVVRLDAIKDACELLPGNHGLLFPQGYYLQSGSWKLFDVPVATPVFEKKICSNNGEDCQYLFYNAQSGLYLIYSYNMIEQTIETPIISCGHTHFGNGEMVVFKHEDDPRKNHMVQIWQTPFTGKNHVMGEKSDSLLYKIGNKDIVRCMADCMVIWNLIQKGEGYQSIYVDIVKQSEQLMDAYFWLDKEETGNLREVLAGIKETAAYAIGEFEKVTRLRANTQQAVAEADRLAQELIKAAEYGHFETVEDFIKLLSELRTLRGRIVSLKELRYVELENVEALEAGVKAKTDDMSTKCVSHLLKPEGLKPYRDRVADLSGQVGKITGTQEGKALAGRLDEASSALELLIDIVSNFNIEDPSKTTEIIEQISGIFAFLNECRAKLKKGMLKLSETEMASQFASQMKLLSQSVVHFLDMAVTSEKCEEYLNKAMVQIQELEGRFADFDQYILELTEKREETYNAFENKKQLLLETRNKKIMTLLQSSDRILKGIESRLKSFATVEEIHAYFASDIMAEKARDLVNQLQDLNDSVKADELEARLKMVKEEALRQLKDKQELYADGKNIIQLGKHLFSVNTQAMDLAIIQQDGELYYHISGTDFHDKVASEAAGQYRHVWTQSVVSENQEVYRAEYLAYKLLQASLAGECESPEKLNGLDDSQLLAVIQKFMEPRYQEGYVKGVHDQDCLKIFKALLGFHYTIDLLTYSPRVRAMAQLYWCCHADDPTKEIISARLKELNKLTQYFKTKPSLKHYLPLVREKMAEIKLPYFEPGLTGEAAEYLCLELMRGEDFVISLEAREVYVGFIGHLKKQNALSEFQQSLKASAADREGVFYLALEWLAAYGSDLSVADLDEVAYEVAALLIRDAYKEEKVVNSRTKAAFSGFVGSHPIIKDGVYSLSYTQFMERLKAYEAGSAQDFLKFQELKKALLAKCREELRLDDFKPAVLSSFVRNQLIDKVYLPLVGANLAKQIGVVGENKRTDLMGLLLLISPPGYGKTTLMEYIANRLGLSFVKVNGPALGNEVLSLDPARAGHESAREELRKLNLALKMGNNVMICLDDIQHCNPEFLQKFISLCDGQRKMDGVWKGIGQTYDLRGKKVVVVMAGNPYTESGEKFKIPDMLSNRADVYNLGDMLRENEQAFKLSYLENSMTSNPVLIKLSNKSHKDMTAFVELAGGADRETVSFEGQYSADEHHEYTSILQKLIQVRDVVLRVNMAYIYSAAQADAYRNEPPFKLQGSYRNMNKIAERVVSAMNETELTDLIRKSYENDAQTLTRDAEANLLKWKELAGVLTEMEKKRWEEIKSLFLKNRLTQGEDRLGQAVMIMSDLNANLGQIKDNLVSAKP